MRQRSTQQGMNPVHTLFVHGGGLRANVFVSNAKIPFLVLLHVAEYLARFVHTVQWILLGIHEFFGTRLKTHYPDVHAEGTWHCHWYFKEVLFHLPVY